MLECLLCFKTPSPNKEWLHYVWQRLGLIFLLFQLIHQYYSTLKFDLVFNFVACSLSNIITMLLENLIVP